MLEPGTAEAFLSLIRLGIGHAVKALPDRIDWEAMKTLAREQELTAIALDGVQALTNSGQLIGDRKMDAALKKKWVAKVFQHFELRYEEYRTRIGELAGFYNSHGFKLMVLKGFGLGLNYPIPAHRPSGDIDIWAFGQYKQADAVLSNELSIPIDSSHHHHTVFSFKGYSVENHYDFLNVHYGHGNTGLEKILKELAQDYSVFTEIDGQRVYLPSADLHALFMLRHAIGHYASTGMNLRMVLDWAFFVEKHKMEIDWPWLQKVLDEYRMTGFFNCLNAISAEDLGFAIDIFPPYRFNPALKKRVLADILSAEFNEPVPKHLLKRIPFKFRRWQANAWKQDLCYGDNRLKALLTGIWSHLLKPASI